MLRSYLLSNTVLNLDEAVFANIAAILAFEFSRRKDDNHSIFPLVLSGFFIALAFLTKYNTLTIWEIYLLAFFSYELLSRMAIAIIYMIVQLVRKHNRPDYIVTVVFMLYFISINLMSFFKKREVMEHRVQNGCSPFHKKNLIQFIDSCPCGACECSMQNRVRGCQVL